MRVIPFTRLNSRSLFRDRWRSLFFLQRKACGHSARQGINLGLVHTFLQELEKITLKEKGIISQSVKEILQSLVDDGFVDSEKIGTSIYFWSFLK